MMAFIFFDDILEDDTTDCLVGEDNSIVRNSNDTNTCSESYYGIYDLVIYLKIELRGLLILEF